MLFSMITACRDNNSNASCLVNKKLLIILALVSIALYCNTLSNGYAYDDFSVIKNNAIVARGISAIPEILYTPYRHGFFVTSNDVYRPLSLVMFAAEYQLSDGEPRASHFINILLFAGCVLLLFVFLDKLFQRKRTNLAFIASLLFALHPVHTEVVANIKSRDELLCFFAAFASLIMFMRYMHTGSVKYLFSGALLFFLSLLSKETSITFLAIVPLVFFFYDAGNRKRSIHITAGTFMAAAIFLAIRCFVLTAYHANNLHDVTFIDNFLVKAPGIGSRFATSIFILGYYLKLFFVPYPLISDYTYNSIPFVTFANLWVWLIISVYVGLAIVCIHRLIKKQKDPVAFGGLFFLSTISLFSNLFFLTGASMAERFLFFPSAGLCIIVAFYVNKLIPAGTGKIPGLLTGKALWIIIPLSIIFAVITMSRNNEWADNLTLFRADVEKAPGNSRLNFFLGNELLAWANSDATDPATKAQFIKEGISYLDRAVTIYPEYADAYRALGNGYFLAGQFDIAEKHLKKAVQLNPRDIESWNSLDVVYFNAGKYSKSIDICRQILLIDTGNIGKYKNISTCYMQLGQYDSSIAALKKGISRDAGYLPFYKDIALAYKLHDMKDSAKRYEAIVRKQEPYFSVY